MYGLLIAIMGAINLYCYYLATQTDFFDGAKNLVINITLIVTVGLLLLVFVVPFIE